jgi:hypothetical protein
MNDNLTNRWYYTDPLSAVWMAIHFGVVLQNKKFCRAGDMLPEYIPEMVYDMLKAREEKYYVHPDSLPFLKPQIGDILDITISPSERKTIIEADETLLRNMENWGMRCNKIIQRNGISFMWPEKSNEYQHQE